MALPRSFATCLGFAIPWFPHGSRRGLFSFARALIRSIPGSPLASPAPKLRGLCADRNLSDIVLELKDLVIDYNPSAHLLRQVMGLPKEQAKGPSAIAGS